MGKSLEFGWEGIYKDWHNLIRVLIRSLQVLYRECRRQDISIRESLMLILKVTLGCHLLSQYLCFFIKSSKIIAFFLGFASHLSCEGEPDDVSDCTEKDNT